MGKLSGKTAIVLGASTGIGRGLARGFAREGADIIALARTLPALETLADEVRAFGRKATVRSFDVVQPGAYPELMRWLDDQKLDFDIVLHTVGGGIRGMSGSDPRLEALFEEGNGRVPFWKIEDRDLDYVFAYGIKSAVSTCKYLASRLMAKGRGSIIVIGSGAGVAGTPQRHADYAMEKGAVMCYVLAIAHELKPHGVAANILMPGHTINERNLKYAGDPSVLTPEDAVPAAVFLAEQDGSGVTGQFFDAREYSRRLQEAHRTEG